MNRLIFAVLFGMILFVNEGSAIKCFVCSSLHDERCTDKNFVASPEFMYDCSADPTRVIPVLHCRKAKYQMDDKWIFVRSCNKRDNLTQAKDAEAYLCHADYCNSAIKFNSGISFMIISVFAAVLNFLRA